jgi:RimJ/RimL family protein N-acetyltransferase
VTAIYIRPLDRSEWEVFKNFRLRALQSEPGVFALSYDSEASHSPEQWQDTVHGPSHQVFGLFDDERLVGITAAFAWRDDPSGQTAILGMSFIAPAYRGRGLSQMLYDARLNWIRAHRQFKKIIVSHRESNEASRRAIERHGFTLSGHSSRTWPDGTAEEEFFYEMNIAPSVFGSIPIAPKEE